MPILIDTNTDSRPNLVLDPNKRFATTFLSNKYRAFSVKGESLQDKQTGEIFTRRPEDGKVVSFFQNKKYMHDLMLELRVLLTNNEWFTLPTSNTAFYVAPDFDLMEFNESKVNNIEVNNTSFGDGIKFHMSGECKGFFIRPSTRDTDKPIIEYTTLVYNNYLKDYSGPDHILITESDRFDNPRWGDSNIIVSYHLLLSNSGRTEEYDLEEYIRFNESMPIQIPENIIAEDFPGGYDYAEITIKSLDYHKLHFLLDNIRLFPGYHAILDNIERLKCPDGEIYAQYMMLQYFVGNVSDIIITNKEVLVALLDIPYVRRYLAKMSRLKDNSDFIVSTTRPYDDDWPANSVWAEWFREISEDGVTVDHPSNLNVDDLNDFYSRGISTKTDFSMDITDTSAIVLVPEI